MIKLDVDDYCHNCGGFDPDVRKVHAYDMAGNDLSDINVVCSMRSYCKNAIKLYERSKKEEKIDD